MRRADSFDLADADSGGEEVLFGAAGILFPLEFSSVARASVYISPTRTRYTSLD